VSLAQFIQWSYFMLQQFASGVVACVFLQTNCILCNRWLCTTVLETCKCPVFIVHCWIAANVLSAKHVVLCRALCMVCSGCFIVVHPRFLLPQITDMQIWCSVETWSCNMQQNMIDSLFPVFVVGREFIHFIQLILTVNGCTTQSVQLSWEECYF